MYTPQAFRQDDTEQLFGLMEEYSFATLISSADDGPRVTHLPVLLERSGSLGTIVGHMAKANPHWRDGAAELLVVYQGPHAYISPSWMDSPNVVPTWNYAAVHARGKVEWIEEADDLLEIVNRYVVHFESAMPSPWKMESNDDAFNRQLLSAIVGFRIPISMLEGKWKLSQNHDPQRRQRVAQQLAGQPEQNSRQLAEWMRQSLES